MEEHLFIATMLLAAMLILIIVANVIKIKHELKNLWSLLSLSASVTLMFLLITIPSVIAIPMFWTYKRIIQCYLKIKHRSQFIGLIEGTDVTYSLYEKSDSIVMILFVYEVSAQKTPTDVFESLRNLVNTHFIGNKHQLSKFNCSMHNFSGYMYMLKENITLDDCVKKIKTINDREEITKEELMTLIKEYTDGKHLKHDRLLWDVIIGTQPVQWKSKPGMKYYPTLIRIHHAICDGFSFNQFIFGIVSDKTNDKIITREAYLRKTTNTNLWSKIAYYVMITLYVFVYSPAMLVIEYVAKKKELNILYGPKLNKISVFSSKVDDGEYFKKVKYIKSCIRGVSFSDILFAALSSSLYEYFEKHSSIPPKCMQVAVPFLQKTTSLLQLPVGSLTVDDINLNNTFDLHTLDLPVAINKCLNQQLPYQHRLKKVQKQTQNMSTSTTNKVLHFVTHNILQLLPLSILRYVIHMMDWAATVTILPCPVGATMANGLLDLQNFVCWIPRMKGIGCNFCVITYGNKLQLGLNVDSVLVPDEEDAQSILDGIFKYLNLLEKEIIINK